jgi:hypothetical protein
MLSYLRRGLPGHPIHPPLTDVTIGAYTGATVMGATWHMCSMLTATPSS